MTFLSALRITMRTATPNYSFVRQFFGMKQVSHVQASLHVSYWPSDR